MVTNGTQKFFTTFDTLSMLSSELNLDDAINTIKACRKNADDYGALDKIERKRVDPKTLFAQLTDDPQEFILQMMRSDTILSGSRAVNYIYPCFECDDSDWDFYCQPAHKWKDFDSYLLRIGAVLEPSTEQSKGRYARFEDIKVRRYTLTRNSKKYDIQIIYPESRYRSAFESITKFHSTAVQCFITGYAAISMYHALSVAGKNIDWTSCREKRDTKSTIKKTMQCPAHKVELCLAEQATPASPGVRSWARHIDRLRSEYATNCLRIGIRREGERAMYSTTTVSTPQEVRNKLISNGTDGVITDVNDRLPEHRKITLDTLVDTITLDCTCKVCNPLDECLDKYTSRGFKLMDKTGVENFKSSYTDDNIMVRCLHEKDVSRVFPLLDYIDSDDIRHEAERKLKKLYNMQWYEVIGENCRGTISVDAPGGKASAFKWYERGNTVAGSRIGFAAFIARSDTDDSDD